MENLRLFIGTVCPFCKRVEKFIEDNKIEGVELVNIDENVQAREELIEKGGKKQVPALDLGDKIMYESLDIMNYLKTKGE